MKSTKSANETTVAGKASGENATILINFVIGEGRLTTSHEMTAAKPTTRVDETSTTIIVLMTAELNLGFSNRS